MRRRIDGHGLGRGFLFRGLEPAWVVLILPYYLPLEYLEVIRFSAIVLVDAVEDPDSLPYLITGWEICDVQPESRRLPVVDD